MALTDTVLRFLQDQTQENFQALRGEVAAAPGFSPYASYAAEAIPLVEANKFTEAAAALQAMMPGSFLSPGVHDMLARIHQLQGNQEEAQNETYLALAILNGILGTGNGSAAKPYQVLQVGDEYDVLKALGKTWASQTLVEREGRMLDRHTCQDGSELWFDITPLVAQPVI